MPSIERLKALQVEHFCDDIEIDEECMIPWSDAQAVRFFESGGADAGDDEIVPCGFPAKWSLFHVSDLHVEHKSNLAWLDTLPDGTPPTMPVPTYVPGKPAQEVAGAGSGVRATPGSVLLCCGDVATEPELLRHSLRAMRRAYETVFFVPGNHDVWTKGPQAGQRAQDSLDKYRRLLQICVEEGVKTAPERLGDAHASATGSSSDGASGGASTPVGGLWVVPIASWYHSSWDREPPLRVPPGMQYAATPRQRHAASDDACCHWPRQMANGSDDVARALDALNDEAPTVHGAGVGGDEGARPAAGAPKGPLSFPAALEAIEQERAACAAAGTALPVVLSCSHFLPRQELLPEKRHLFMPTLHEIVGSDPLRARVDRLRPTAHCFGHTHFAWDMTLDDGVRYLSWPLATPQEQARRVPYALDAAAAKRWLPAKVWDSEAGLAAADASMNNCYFSDLYKEKGRKPDSYEMASYTAAVYCPDAPIDPMISPVRGHEKSQQDMDASQKSLKGQVERGKLAARR